jgi:phosphomannomutase/phosphoglucomutase
MSGHNFFNDRYYGFDDAIHSSFRLLEILSREGRGLGAILADLLETAITPEIRLDYPHARKFNGARSRRLVIFEPITRPSTSTGRG